MKQKIICLATFTFLALQVGNLQQNTIFLRKHSLIYKLFSTFLLSIFCYWDVFVKKLVQLHKKWFNKTHGTV